MRTLRNLALLSTVLHSGGLLAASPIRCEADQKFCVVENKRLITGDQVLFINDDDEIVATGDVSDMSGRDRKIEITKRYGLITSDVRVKRSDDNVRTNTTGYAGTLRQYQTYKAPGKIAAGASLGLTQMNIASDALAYSAEGFGQYVWRQIPLTGRVHGFSASGTLDKAEENTQAADYSVTGLVVMGGAAYKFFPKSPLALRANLEAGVAYTSVTTTGVAYVGSVDKLGNGLGLAARMGADLIYTKFGEWQPMGTVSFSQINQARGTTLGLGIMKDLR